MGRLINKLRMSLAKRLFLKIKSINHKVRGTLWSKKFIPCKLEPRVQATKVGILHGGPELKPRVFTCAGRPGGY